MSNIKGFDEGLSSTVELPFPDFQKIAKASESKVRKLTYKSDFFSNAGL